MKSLRSRSKRSGSVIIEFALLFPVMMLMALGTADVGRVFYAGIAVANAARAGVQFGALDPGNAGNFTGMQQAALNDAANQGLTGITAVATNFCGCAGSSSTVACGGAAFGTCSVGGTTTAPNGYVRVTVTYTYNTLVNYPGIPSTIGLSRTATMRVQ
jgi:Flp pilus assembly protein TadG